MSSDEEYEQEEQTIASQAVAEKYRIAAKIANGALQRAVDQLSEGKSVLEICEATDKFIVEQTAPIYKKGKVTKGVAFPTCLSINNVVGHFSPEAGDKTTLKNGDVVKIDLGVHIDGFIAVAAHTHVVGNVQLSPVSGKAADAICAAHIAGDAVLRLLKPGKKNVDIAPVVQAVCDAFHVTTVEAVLSHRLQQHVIAGTKVIPNKLLADQAVEEFEIEEHDVFAIDIVVSTGTGKTREEDVRPTVYKRDVDNTYRVKLQAARKILIEIGHKFPALPFSIRSIEEKHARYGFTELEKHGLVQPYPVLYEKPGEIVAHFKYTAFVTPNGGERITGIALPYVHSQYTVENAKVKELLSQEVGPKKKVPQAAAPETTTTSTKPEETPADVAPMETN